MNKTTKNILIILAAAVTTVALYYLIAYIYLSMYAAFTWQCNIYVGEKTVAAQQTCDEFNERGLIRLLTF